MSYIPEYEDEAIEDLADLPVDLADQVVYEINSLAQAPVSVSRASFPHPFAQAYDFWATYDENNWHMRVLFKYGQDERHIHIVGIGSTLALLDETDWDSTDF